MPLLNLTIDARFRFDENGRLSVRVLDPKAPGLKLLNILPTLIGYRIRKAEKIFRRILADEREIHYFKKVSDGFLLDVDPGDDLNKNVPREGPLVVVANHPLNGIDGMAIAAALSDVRPDLKVMLTTTFDGIPGLKDFAIFVNASEGPSSEGRAGPVREAIGWLESGHALILFPAGQGSYLSVEGRRDPVDVDWSLGVSTLLKNTGASAVPIYVNGSPSPLFLKTRRFFRPLATLFLLREILIQEGAKVSFQTGHYVTNDDIKAQGGRRQQVQYLRDLTYALADEK